MDLPLACMCFATFSRNTNWHAMRNRRISRRRKSTVQKYDPPYSKKPQQKSYSGVSGNHHAEAAALDTVNKILTFGRMPHYRYDGHFVAYFASRWLFWIIEYSNTFEELVKKIIELCKKWVKYIENVKIEFVK